MSPRQAAQALTAFLSFALAAVPPCGAADPVPFPPQLDAYVASGLRDSEVPGAILTIVKDGQVVVAKGYGVRALGRPEAVDGDTIFDIASLTKAFSAAAIATLVDEGKLAWDKPVHDYLPALQFSDAYLNAHVSLRDLLSHRTGLRNNAAPFRGHLTRAQVVGLFAHLETTDAFRSSWVYSNVGYAAAGEVAAAVSGKTWEELVTGRILVPLGMTRTTADFDAVPSLGNYASGHVVIDGVQRAVPRGSERLSTAAAGAIHSSARDLATWMLFQLGDGSVGGKRLVSADAMEEMHGPQVFVPTTATFRASRQLRHFAAYGFGWQVWDYRGHPLLWHTGSGDGQAAYLCLLPESRLGVALVTNTWRPGVLLNLALVARVIDHYLALPTRDYAAEFRVAWEKGEKAEAADEAALLAARLRDTTPSLPLAAYAGHYRDQLGLDVEVKTEKEGLSLTYAGGEPATLEHWHRDTFRARWPNPYSQGRPAFVSFDVDEHGKLSRLRMELLRDKIDAVRDTTGH